MSKARLAVLLGTLDTENPFSILRANADVWREVFRRVDEWYEQHIDRRATGYSIIRLLKLWRWRRDGAKPDTSLVTFPPPQDLNINMMPIKPFQLQTIPDNCAQYTEMICDCTERIPRRYRGQYNKVAYLTIHESWVPVGQAHRRPGLHVERPGGLRQGGHLVGRNDPGWHELKWGGGPYFFAPHTFPVDGIYMASNVDDSSRVWPALILDSREASDAHGGIEHMREHLGPGHSLKANELCWITDRTPHESVPLQAPADDPNAELVYRQFFRLVVGEISVWYTKHNTPNPTGLVKPDAKISDVDKFEMC